MEKSQSLSKTHIKSRRIDILRRQNTYTKFIPDTNFMTEIKSTAPFITEHNFSPQFIGPKCNVKLNIPSKIENLCCQENQGNFTSRNEYRIDEFSTKKYNKTTYTSPKRYKKPLDFTKCDSATAARNFVYNAGYEFINKENVKEQEDAVNSQNIGKSISKRKYNEIIGQKRTKSVPKISNIPIADMDIYYEKMEQFKYIMTTMNKKFHIDEHLEKARQKSSRGVRKTMSVNFLGAKKFSGQHQIQIEPRVTFFDTPIAHNLPKGRFIDDAINMRKQRMKAIYEKMYDQTGIQTAKKLFNEYFIEGCKVINSEQLEHDLLEKQRMNAEEKIGINIIKVGKKEQEIKLGKEAKSESPREKLLKRTSYGKLLLYQKKKSTIL